MKLTTREPSEELQNIVKHFWKLQISTDDVPFSHPYFPYGSFELIVYLHEPGIMNFVGSKKFSVQPRIFFSGQLTMPFIMHFKCAGTILGVSLKPWMGNVLFDVPGDKFTNQLIELRDLTSFLPEIHDQQTDDVQFAELEGYLKKLFRENRVDKMITNLALEIFQHPSRGHVQKCINGIGYSRRRIEQRFLAATGLNIGTFSRKVRFQKSIQSMYCRRSESLTSIAHDSGYYDQSHFISEFKSFATFSPSVFMYQPGEFKNILSALTTSPV